MSIERKNHGTGHSYAIDGARVDGVTTLLSEGTPSGGLIPWAAACVAERVADMLDEEIAELRASGRQSMIDNLKKTYAIKRQRLAVRGTKVHAIAEKIVRGEPVELDDEALYGYALSAAKFMNEWHVRPILSEQVVGSRQWAYAGTLDLIADMANHRVLIDYKTGLRPPHWRSALQLAAYRHADCYVTSDRVEIPMSEVGIEQSYVVQVRDDGYDVFPVETDKTVFRAFLHVAHVARETRYAPAWIGAPIWTAEMAA